MVLSWRKALLALCATLVLIGSCEGRGFHFAPLPYEAPLDDQGLQGLAPQGSGGIKVARTDLQGLKDLILPPALIGEGGLEQVQARKFGNDRAFALFSNGRFGLESGVMISTGDAYECDIENPSRDFTPTATETNYTQPVHTGVQHQPVGDEAGLEVSFIAKSPIELTFQYVFASRGLPNNVIHPLNQDHTEPTPFTKTDEGRVIEIDGGQAVGIDYDDQPGPNWKGVGFSTHLGKAVALDKICDGSKTGRCEVRIVNVDPSHDGKVVIDVSLNSVFTHTQFKNTEILIRDNGKVEILADRQDRDAIGRSVEWLGDTDPSFRTSQGKPYADGQKRIVSVEDKLRGKVLLSDGTAFENPADESTQTRREFLNAASFLPFNIGKFMNDKFEMSLNKVGFAYLSDGKEININNLGPYALDYPGSVHENNADFYGPLDISTTRYLYHPDYINNTYRDHFYGYTGYTRVRTTKIIAPAGMVNTINISIADVYDGNIDSVAFIKVAGKVYTEPKIYRYNPTFWSACSVTCGTGGVKLRLVTCVEDSITQDKIRITKNSVGTASAAARTGVSVDLALCDGAGIGPTPSTQETCIADVVYCPSQAGVGYKAGPWGTCSVSCGDGVTARAVTCETPDGSQAPLTECGKVPGTQVPDGTKLCNDGPCPVYQVDYEGWGPCSNECGIGTQTRTSRCIERNSVTVVADSFCPTSLPTTQACNNTLCPPCATWTDSVGDQVPRVFTDTTGYKTKVFTDASGYITDGMGDYGNLALCAWLITPTTPQRITLNFDSIQLEKDHDYIRVYDGSNDEAPLLAMIQGDVTGRGNPEDRVEITALNNAGPFVAESGSMYITLKTDHWKREQGFFGGYQLGTGQFTGTSQCKGVVIVTDDSGSITDGEGDYGADKVCTWRIIPEHKHYKISLSFGEFQLENGYDTVTIYDGPEGLPGAPNKIAVLTGTGLTTVDAYSGSMTVVFSSDQHYTDKGFMATYAITAVKPPYAVTLPPTDPFLTSKEGRLDSSKCSTAGKCVWVIKPVFPAGAVSEIRLIFASFSTEISLDYVTVTDGSTQVGIFTGTTLPDEQVATSGSMTVALFNDGTQAFGQVTAFTAAYTSSYYCPAGSACSASSANKAAEVLEGSDDTASTLLPTLLGCVCAAVAIALVATGGKYYHSHRAMQNTVTPVVEGQTQCTKPSVVATKVADKTGEAWVLEDCENVP